VIPEQTRARKQAHGPKFLGKAAGACGSVVNSVLVHLGDTFGLYPTGQYELDQEPFSRGHPLMVAPLYKSRGTGTDGLSCETE
jgi:hypothetical protein